MNIFVNGNAEKASPYFARHVSSERLVGCQGGVPGLTVADGGGSVASGET
jgi:hypothetical protein